MDNKGWFLAGIGVGAAAVAAVVSLSRRTRPSGTLATRVTDALTPKSGSACLSKIEAVGEPIPDDVKAISRRVIDTGTRWLKFGVVTFQSPSRMKEPCDWEMVERNMTVDDVDGADAVAIIRTPGMAPRLILILCYRPPVDSVVVEFPSGLVDKGESATVAAVRELREETGYVGTAVHSSEILYVDPWKSTETCRYVFVDVDGSLPENKSPEAEREDMELQQVLLVPIPDLLTTLAALEKERGYKIDARLRSMAMGMCLAPAL